MTHLRLISHVLCPYVQRAAIVLHEKAVAHERIDVDLANKPDWFLAISPLGKTPVLQVDDVAIFESAVIAEYLDETAAPQLLPADPLGRAEHRAWVEFASATLSAIGGLYGAPDAETFEQKRADLSQKFKRLETRLNGSAWFDGDRFGLVDAAFGPVFRYFDVIDQIVELNLFNQRPKTAQWRQRLAERPSVRAAASPDYHDRLFAFFKRRNSHLGDLTRRQDRAVAV